jgi:hypothetical protein
LCGSRNNDSIGSLCSVTMPQYTTLEWGNIAAVVAMSPTVARTPPQLNIKMPTTVHNKLTGLLAKSCFNFFLFIGWSIKAIQPHTMIATSPHFHVCQFGNGMNEAQKERVNMARNNTAPLMIAETINL